MIGQTISHYRIITKLGAGGMGEVFRAEDIKLKRTVALKFLPPELTRDAEAKRRFLHEAEAAAALDHPNICTVHEVGETEDGQLFIAMACYTGETLRDRIARGPLPLEEAAADRGRSGGGAGPCPRPGDRAPGREAGQPVRDRGGTGQGARLRAGEAVGEIGADAERLDAGDGGVHVAGAGAGNGSRFADGHLVAGSGALRDGGRTPAVCRGIHRGAGVRDSERGTPAAHRPSDRGAAAAGRGDGQGAGQGSGGTLPDAGGPGGGPADGAEGSERKGGSGDPRTGDGPDTAARGGGGAGEAARLAALVGLGCRGGGRPGHHGRYLFLAARPCGKARNYSRAKPRGYGPTARVPP